MFEDTTKYLKIRAPKPLGKGDNWHYLMKMRTNGGMPLNVEPTVGSRDAGPGNYLEWLVPDNTFNRTYMNMHLSAYTLVKDDKKAEEPKKKIFFSKKDKEKEDSKQLSPEQVKELKSKIKEELDVAGIKYSKTASLKELQDLVPKAVPKK